MRVQTKGAPWILQIWLNQEDLEALAGGEPIEAVSADGVEVMVRPGDAQNTRLARAGPESAVFHVPRTAVDDLVEGRTRRLKAFNGALPLSVTISAELGIGLPTWLIEADLQW